MKRAAAAFAAFVLVSGLAGHAAAAPSQRSLDLAHRYVAAMDLKKSFAPMLDNLTNTLLKQQMDAVEGDEATKAKVTKAMQEAMSETFSVEMLEKMMTAMEPAIAETFTEEELQAMVDFYESPVGRSIVAKMPAFGVKSSQAMLKVMPEMQADLIKRLRDKLAVIEKQAK